MQQHTVTNEHGECVHASAVKAVKLHQSPSSQAAHHRISTCVKGILRTHDYTSGYLQEVIDEAKKIEQGVLYSNQEVREDKKSWREEDPNGFQLAINDATRMDRHHKKTEGVY